ncbi:putative MFS sugar transporter [Elsinoe ampelina]|uniref:Putative MFS sugar transporter n=1 Tax=Elsinoe ampelina TaxID=302913 RepID=A0A6A6G4Y6_9PEZI|nr:putative MFS sugar transporter [Elsinoe ampelina]
MAGATHAPGAADPILTKAIEADKVPWYQKPNLRSLYLLLFPTCMGIEITSGFDSQMINAVQIVDSWKIFFGRPTGALQGIIGAMYSLGAICSLPFVGIINDRFGRRWAIFIGSCIMIFGAILQAASNGVGMYLAARFFLGFGIPMCIVAGSALLGELGYPKERPILTSLFNSSYFIGAILAAGITFGTMTIPNDWGWRVPSLLQAAPSLLQVCLIFFIPESPRHLISKDRKDEARAILIKYHAEGDANSELVNAEIAQIEATIFLELEQSKQSWADLFRTKGMQRRMLISGLLGLFTQWSGNTLISYYLDKILTSVGFTDPMTKGKLNVGLTCWNLINGTIIALLVGRFRRRVMYLICTCSLLVVYVGWTITQERYLATASAAAGNLVIFWMFAYSPCYNMGYNALTYTFLVELWPFAQRSRGIAFFQLFGRGAGFFNTFVNPIGLDDIGWKYLITYCCWIAFEIVVVYFLFPETSGRTLEELAFLFEDSHLAEEQARVTDKQLHGGAVELEDKKDATIQQKEVA